MAISSAAPLIHWVEIEGSPESHVGDSVAPERFRHIV
jgi:hypothetical protein